MVNRLATEPSPYLRQHADNPVDWYPWGDEALERARREHKPILLSVGYSACHWCHVMAHESFENAQTAARMNEWFINVKVDREERPDLDQVYQGVVALMGRGGGWPLTVFLTPDLRPFFGGTYFPPEDRYGMPGFPRLLEALHQAWTTKAGEVEEQASAFAEGLSQLARQGLEGAPSEWRPEDVVAAAQTLAKAVDGVNGGFGSAPKFPNPMNVALLMRGYRRSGDASLWGKASHTLEKMAEGGIYDQLGGGFHRYAVDAHWRVPHFEKMLYDNAQLLHLYAEAHQLEPRPLWRRVVEETVEYVRREMTAPEGGFYAAQDADSEGEEGKFFIWRPAEVDAALGPELGALARARFGVTEEGNFEHGATVLELRAQVEALATSHGLSVGEVEARLGRARRTLLEARAQRTRPGLDDKVLAGWNGLMVRGLAFAGRVFQRPDWVALAQQAADFLWRELWKDGVLLRAWQGAGRIEGFVEDSGGLAAGLVALYQATFDVKYLEAAEQAVDAAVAHFWDEAQQAYRTARPGPQALPSAPYALHDNAVPSGASLLVEAQVALAAITGRTRHLDQAWRYLRRLREEALRNPFAFGHLLQGADAALDGAACAWVVGEGPAAEALREVVSSAYAPTVAVAWVPTEQRAPQALATAAAGKGLLQGAPAAYLCQSFRCDAPVTDPAALRRLLPSPAQREPSSPRE